MMNLRPLGQNAILYAIGNISIRLGSFLLIPLYTHSLTISEYGLLMTLLMTIQFLAPVIGLGTPTGFIRFADEYLQKGRLGSLVSSTIIMQVGSGLVVTCICVFFLLPFFRKILHTEVVLAYVVLTCLSALALSLFDHITSYFRVRSEGIKFIIAGSSAFAILLLTNFVFLRVYSWGIKGALIAQVITYGGLWILILIHVLLKNRVGLSARLTRKLFEFSFPLVFAMSSEVMVDVSAVYLLSLLTNLEQVAIYSIAYKIVSIAGIVLILPFQLAYEPFVYQNAETPGIQNTISKILTYLMLCFSFVAFAIVFIARDLLHVIAPPEYFAAYPVVFLMLPAVAFKGVYYIGESLLNIKHRTKFVGIVVSSMAVIGIGLNFLFIEWWGMSGALFVYNFTVITTGIVLMAIGNKSFPITIEWRRLIFIAVLTISLMLSVFFLHRADNFLYYFAVPLIGAASLAYIYFGSFCYLEEKFAIKNFIQRIQTNPNH